ncbi:hypothetical protein [Hymenobacter sp. PAMC 26628]|uniref:hypothetical protein n=1 Tax=Hymenobacter sp. PAMC 26628 TaxID=1484118 RepID=UPI0007703F0B|nr:hypothetical protein [Hymenobacter sp. PAMC 26628]AMJ67014.1 hypothetical protein AXW84_17425 [Hymenobacter sp. PAMC 26628]
MDPSLETALAALRQVRNDRQNGLITDRDYDRRIATLLQGKNAPALLALLQAEAGTSVVPGPPAAPAAPALPVPMPTVGPGRAAPPTVPTPDFLGNQKSTVPPATPVPDFMGSKRPVPPAAPPVAAPPPTAVEDEGAAELGAPPAGSSTLNYVLIGGGVLLLLLLVAYLMSGPRSSEHLTSGSRTAADSAAAAPEVGPQAPQLERPPVAAPETVRVFPQVAPIAPALDSTAATPAAVPRAAAADSTATPSAADGAPAATAAATEQAVRGALASYYADLQAAPFDAGAHFAPTVERFLLLRGTTPTAIAENLATNHFPEFQDYQASIAPGSLRVSAPVADGTRTATYVEVARSFRPTLQQHQQTRTQVRVRFTPDYKIDYLRQEKIIENTLTP